MRKENETAPNVPAGMSVGVPPLRAADAAAVLSKTSCTGRPVAVAEGVCEVVEVSDPLAERVPERLGVPDPLPDGVRVPLELGVALTLGVGVRVPVTLKVLVIELVPEGLGVALPLGVPVGVGEQTALMA